MRRFLLARLLLLVPTLLGVLALTFLLLYVAPGDPVQANRVGTLGRFSALLADYESVRRRARRSCAR